MYCLDTRHPPPPPLPPHLKPAKNPLFSPLEGQNLHSDDEKPPFHHPNGRFQPFQTPHVDDHMLPLNTKHLHSMYIHFFFESESTIQR
jgi:hypothetical protein